MLTKPEIRNKIVLSDLPRLHTLVTMVPEIPKYILQEHEHQLVDSLERIQRDKRDATGFARNSILFYQYLRLGYSLYPQLNIRFRPRFSLQLIIHMTQGLDESRIALVASNVFRVILQTQYLSGIDLRSAFWFLRKTLYRTSKCANYSVIDGCQCVGMCIRSIGFGYKDISRVNSPSLAKYKIPFQK